jgi:hypothetical protein
MPSIVHPDHLEHSGAMSNHRGGNIDFLRLHRGEPGDPGNFEWSIIETTPEYATPRHRHNFDQAHFILSGRHQWGPDQWMPTGSIGYFVEGCFYGPQAGGPSRQLGLQMGGASGSGFMSYDQLARGNQDLAAKGTFGGGKFTWVDDDGKQHNSDGYEAIWEHVNGRKVSYPEPRYDKPVIIYPDAMRWRASSTEAGVSRKHAGSFGERDLSIGFWGLDAGARHDVAAPVSTVLQFVVSGSITAGDDPTVLRPESALKWGPDEGGVITAIEPAVIYEVRMPEFD